MSQLRLLKINMHILFEYIVWIKLLFLLIIGGMCVWNETRFCQYYCWLRVSSTGVHSISLYIFLLIFITYIYSDFNTIIFYWVKVFCFNEVLEIYLTNPDIFMLYFFLYFANTNGQDDFQYMQQYYTFFWKELWLHMNKNLYDHIHRV